MRLTFHKFSEKEFYIMIRMCNADDLGGLLMLYTHLHKGSSMPQMSTRLGDIWKNMCLSDSYGVIVAEENGKIVSSCVVVIIDNLTHGSRPFAIIENVVTHEKFRRKGLAAQCIEYACEYARMHNCYKIMLMSSSEKDDAHRLYEKCDFNSNDKTGFVKWL